MLTSSKLGPCAEIKGIIQFTEERAQRGFRLNKFLVSMSKPENRAAFVADPDAYMLSLHMSGHEQTLIRDRNFDGMLEHGASIYALGKASAVLGTDLIGIGAKSRGQTSAEFINERLSKNGAHADPEAFKREEP